MKKSAIPPNKIYINYLPGTGGGHWGIEKGQQGENDGYIKIEQYEQLTQQMKNMENCYNCGNSGSELKTTPCHFCKHCDYAFDTKDNWIKRNKWFMTGYFKNYSKRWAMLP